MKRLENLYHRDLSCDKLMHFKCRICRTFNIMDGCKHESIKGPSPLTWFTITIENSNTSKYSTGEKGERGKRKQNLFIEGTLLCYFFLASYLSKQHKCNCLSKTNEAVKSHRPRYRLAFIDLWQ